MDYRDVEMITERLERIALALEKIAENMKPIVAPVPTKEDIARAGLEDLF